MYTFEKEQEITLDEVMRFIKRHRGDCGKFDFLEKYYLGEHEILLRQKEEGLANNLLICNHAKYITDTAVGYLTGNPIQYASKRGKQSIFDIIEWLDSADSDTQDIDLATSASIFGVGYEMVYMSSDECPVPKLANLDPRNAFVVYDNTVENRPLFGVYYYPILEDGRTVGYRGYVSTDEDIWEIYSDGDFLEVRIDCCCINPFGEVSIIEYYNNGNRQGDFEQVTNLIDAYNLLQSDRVNDKEQFVRAVLLIKGQVLGNSADEESEAYQQIREHGLLMLDESSSAEWLCRQFDEQSVEILRRSIEQDIHKFANVPCLTDQNFGVNSSGVALRYKLLGFEQMTKIKERYFKEGLQMRLRLFANAMALMGYGKVDLNDIEITFVRSLPINELELSQMIVNLADFVPQEHLLKLLPFIKNPVLAAKQMEEKRGGAVC